MASYDYVKNNLLSLSEELRLLCKKLGKDPVRLVCVTKSATDEEVLALLEGGATDIGENRPQMLKARGTLAKDNGFSPCLHEIGNLQKNKVKMIIDSTSLIHSLDSVGLAEKINTEAAAHGIKVRVLVEVNSALEKSKGGIMPEEAADFIREISKYDSIIVSGLMTMGPVCENIEDIRPYFKATKMLFDSLVEDGLLPSCAILSMGMSDSYRIAVEEGATLVRVGRKLFEKPKGEDKNV